MIDPPYELNDKMVNTLASILNELKMLEFNKNVKSDLKLRKASKIKSVNSSCAIESNGLSFDEVTSVINGKVIMAKQSEISEVKNAYNAYNKILSFDPYSVTSLLMAHQILTTQLIVDSGKFRNNDVGVWDGSKLIHLGVRPEFVANLIHKLFDWGRNCDLHPLIKSSVIHFEIEFIHPFSDGNGRVGRLWQSLILTKYNNIFEYLPIETLIYENQTRYYDAISNSENIGSSTPFIEFMLDMIYETILRFNNEYLLNNVKGEILDKLSKMEKEIINILLTYFSNNEFIDNGIAVILLGKSKVNVRKYFTKFVKMGILIPIGENKGRKYQLNKDIIKARKSA